MCARILDLLMAVCFSHGEVAAARMLSRRLGTIRRSFICCPAPQIALTPLVRCNMPRGLWTAEEDEALAAAVEKHGLK
jgi:hypothetical protein